MSDERGSARLTFADRRGSGREITFIRWDSPDVVAGLVAIKLGTREFQISPEDAVDLAAFILERPCTCGLGLLDPDVHLHHCRASTEALADVEVGGKGNG